MQIYSFCEDILHIKRDSNEGIFEFDLRIYSRNPEYLNFVRYIELFTLDSIIPRIDISKGVGLIEDEKLNKKITEISIENHILSYRLDYKDENEKMLIGAPITVGDWSLHYRSLGINISKEKISHRISYLDFNRTN